MTGRCHFPTHRVARAAIACGTLLMLAAGAACADDTAASAPIALAPGLPTTLDGATCQRLGLFPAEPGIVQVQFTFAKWGGVVAHIEQVDDGVRQTRLRFLTWQQWQDLRQRAADILAGTAPPPPPVPITPGSEDDPARRLRAWPEVPLATLAVKGEAAPRVPPGFPPLRGRWMAMLEAGVRNDITDFDQFFTPMGMIGIGFGYPFLEHAAAVLNFAAGFGNMRSRFEDAFGDGRTNTFSFSLGLVGRQRLSHRTSVYAQVDGGYYIRSLLWGGLFVDPYTGELTNGLVLEQQNWGYALRAGILLQRRHASRPRFFDIGVSWQTTPADTWDFTSDNDRFTASGHDTWVSIAVRFWDSI